LYDNAQLVPLFVDAFRASGDAFFARVARETLDYVLREMTSPEGGFYATQDADSEGVEGKFFVWSRAEVVALLGEETAEIFCRVYDVTDEGNFEHANILHRTLTDEQAAKMFRRDPAEVTKLLADARRKLFEAREKRPKPFRDEKIVVAWNGLMISAFARAFAAFGDEKLRAAAERALAFIDAKLWKSGRLQHVFKDGEARVPAFLDDVAALGLASLDVYEATADPAHLERAEKLARVAIDDFADDAAGGFFYTPADHEKLIVRTKPAYDGSVPSGNSLAADLCLRLHHFTGDAALLARAERIIELHRDSAEENPFAHGYLLGAIDLYARGPEEVVVVAEGGAGAAADLLQPVRTSYRANRFVFAYDPGAPPARLPPFATEKPMQGGRPTAYVCRGFTCSAPATSWSELEERLRA
ncbi:MAG: thioredoxin domain-containing protein, partial [Candidatus Binatia bacterium]